jgi:hypothetical protein
MFCLVMKYNFVTLHAEWDGIRDGVFTVFRAHYGKAKEGCRA